MPRLEYDVVFNINTKSVETLEQNLNKVSQGGDAKGIERVKEETNELNVSLDRTASSADEAKQALQGISSGSTSIKRMESNMRGAQQQTEQFNKTANNSNQILFSFGDAMQDSSQFSQGFSSGMRAVGNNLTFATEQISIMVSKAGSGKAAMRSLAGAMLGPAGLVFAINAAVTAITLFSQSADKAKRETKELTEDVVSFADEASSISKDLVFDPLGAISQQERIDQLQNVQDELGNLFDLRQSADDLQASLVDIETQMAKTSITSGALGQSFQRTTDNTNSLSGEQDRISGLLRDVNVQIAEQEDIFGELSKVERQQIEDKIDDAKATASLKNALVELNPTLKLQKEISEEVSPVIRDLNLGLESSEEAVRNLHSEYQDQIQVLRTQNELTEDEKNQLFTLTKARDELRDAVSDYLDEQEGAKAVTEEQRRLLDEMGLSAKNAKDEIEKLSDELPEQERSFIPDQPAQKSVENLKSQVSAMESFRDKLDLTTTEGQLGYNRLSKAIRRTKDEIDDLTGAAEEQSTVISKELSDAISAVLDGASQLTSSITQLANTRAEARIREAEAAGASASRIQQLERERFEAQKKAAIANAVINTAQGVTKALGSYAPPWSFIQAGLVSTAGAIQLAAIKAQQFGGGGNVTGSSSPSQQGFNVSDVQNNQEPEPQVGRDSAMANQPINITLNTEADNRIISKKAEQGGKERRDKAIKVS